MEILISDQQERRAIQSKGGQTGKGRSKLARFRNGKLRLHVIDALDGVRTLSCAYSKLMRIVLAETSSDGVMILEKSADGRTATIVTHSGTKASLTGPYHLTLEAVSDPKYINPDIFFGSQDDALERSILGYAIKRMDLPPIYFVCVSASGSEFSEADKMALGMIAQAAESPLTAIAAVEMLRGDGHGGNQKTPATSDLDTDPDPRLLTKMSRDMNRLTSAQGTAMSVLNSIHTVETWDFDRAVVESLANICTHSNASSAIILDIGSDGLSHVLHGWFAPGQPAPNMEGLQCRRVLKKFAYSELSNGRSVAWSSNQSFPSPFEDHPAGLVAVAILPIMRFRSLTGFLCIEHFDAPYEYLSGELLVLQAIASAIGAEAHRRDTLEALEQSNVETKLQRLRLEATLAALPDLVVEVDQDERFVEHYSQHNPTLRTVGDRLVGKRMEEVLSPALLKVGRDVIAEVELCGRSESAPFSYEIAEGDTRWVRAIGVRREVTLPGQTDRHVTLLVLRDVTREVKQAEEIQRLSEVAKRTQNLVIVTDAEWKTTWVNASFVQRTGLTLEDVSGMLPGDYLFPRGEAWDLRNFIRHESSEGRSTTVEIEATTAEGERFSALQHVVPVADISGTINSYLCIMTDVTEQKRHQKALAEAAEDARRTRAQLVAAIESLEDGIVVFDKDMRVVLCNDVYRSMFPGVYDVVAPGATLDEILRCGVEIGAYDLPKGSEEAWIDNRKAKLLAGDSEMEVRLTNGKWVRAVDKRTPDGGWVGLRMDITAFKTATETAVSDRALAMSATQDAMALTAPDGVLTYANPAFIAMFGKNQSDGLIGLTWQKVLGADLSNKVIEKGLLAISGWKDFWRDEIDLGPQFDALSRIEVTVTRRKDNGLLWTIRDLTKDMLAEQERTQLSEDLQLAQRREVIGQLAAGLAHDFNNLIAAISGSAMLICDDSPKSSGTWANADRILKSSARAEAMVRKLLALGARPNQHKRVALQSLIREAADLLKPAMTRSIRLRVVADPLPIVVDVETNAILQAVLNLGVNARDAITGRKRNNDPAEVTLSVGLAEPGEFTETPIKQIGTIDPSLVHARISVADTGDGITAETAEKVFSPYFTTKGHKGTGLGLSIVSNTVKASQGAVCLFKSKSGGAEFRIYLPVADQGQDHAALANGAPFVADLPSDAAVLNMADLHDNTGDEVPVPGKPLTGSAILLVDDAEDVLEVLASVLERAGAEVAPTSNPEIALEVLEEDPSAFDLVITDFDMGAITGADLARRAHELRAELPVILITALVDWASRDNAQAASQDPAFFQVLGKPISSSKLVNTAVNALNDKKL